MKEEEKAEEEEEEAEEDDTRTHTLKCTRTRTYTGACTASYLRVCGLATSLVEVEGYDVSGGGGHGRRRDEDNPHAVSQLPFTYIYTYIAEKSPVDRS